MACNIQSAKKQEMWSFGEKKERGFTQVGAMATVAIPFSRGSSQAGVIEPQDPILLVFRPFDGFR